MEYVQVCAEASHPVLLTVVGELSSQWRYFSDEINKFGYS